MTSNDRSEPILPVPDINAARAFYQALGFRAGFNDGPYEIMRRGGLCVHLEERPRMDVLHNPFSCYWRVTDADPLYREFAATGLFTQPHRLSEPADEPWGMREFTLKDPGGNLIRIGHDLWQQTTNKGGRGFT